MYLQKKDEFYNDVIHIINHLCKLVFNLHSEQDVEKVFGVSQKKLEDVLKKIIDSMPNQIFDLPPQRLEEIKSIFSKEFIFFQVQEKMNDPNYEHDLSNFIYAFSRDIQSKFAALAREEK